MWHPGGVAVEHSTSDGNSAATENFTPAYMKSPDFPYTKQVCTCALSPASSSSLPRLTCVPTLFQYEQPSAPPPPSGSLPVVRTPLAEPAVLSAEASVLKHIHALLRANTLPLHVAEPLGLLALQGDSRVRILWEAFSTDDEAFVKWSETLAQNALSVRAGTPGT